MGNVNAKSAKGRTRRAKTRRNGDSNGASDRRLRQLGQESGNQSIGADHPTGIGQDPGASRLESLGGIYGQLLEEAEEQLAELHDRLDDIRTKAVKYEQRIEKLQARRQQILESLESWQQTLHD